jgi:hypothetical protein
VIHKQGDLEIPVAQLSLLAASAGFASSGITSRFAPACSIRFQLSMNKKNRAVQGAAKPLIREAGGILRRRLRLPMAE